MSTLKKIWFDPVGCQLIAMGIGFLVSLLYQFVLSLIIPKTFPDIFRQFWTTKIDLWAFLAFMLLFSILMLNISRRMRRKRILPEKELEKYYGVYEVFHFAPYSSSGNIKISNAFLHISGQNIQYVHHLFECEDGGIEKIDGHLFVNLRNKDKKNAPYFLILSSINSSHIDYISGACLGIGENQPCRPVATKIALKKRDEISDFSISQFKSSCGIMELTPEKRQEQPYKYIIESFLLNKCPDKDILF